MVEYTREKQKTVTEEETVKECDYCRLITSDDIEEWENFSEMLLNPRTVNSSSNKFMKYLSGDFFREVQTKVRSQNQQAEMEDDIPKFEELCPSDHQDMFFSIIRDLLNELRTASDDTADLCPKCAEQLFRDGPGTMVRQGTGYIGASNDEVAGPEETM
jgi:ssDNA-binding Zn-finger/Zn-ribbon topoisomerase 1